MNLADSENSTLRLNQAKSQKKPQNNDVRKRSRGDKTAIELFLSGVRALALQSSIIDVIRIASRISTATG
jgi:hypothetical protein